MTLRELKELIDEKLEEYESTTVAEATGLKLSENSEVLFSDQDGNLFRVIDESPGLSPEAMQTYPPSWPQSQQFQLVIQITGRDEELN